MPRIVIVPARPSWRNEFEGLKAVLAPLAPPRSRLHHIGSTAVPGLAAKDVIDLQLTVEDLALVDDERLAEAGFRRKHGVADHCPPGMTLEAIELEKRFYTHAPRPANLHVRQAGRFNQRYPLLCRDYLRANALAANAYAQLKEHLARRFPDDADAYYEIKDPVFDILMAGADAWALRTGWREPPPD